MCSYDIGTTDNAMRERLPSIESVGVRAEHHLVLDLEPWVLTVNRVSVAASAISVLQ